MKAFDKIYLDYFDAVYHYVLSLCKDENWAEDITQEAFFKALKNIDKYRGESKLNVWLCQIAKNTFYDEVKKKNRFQEMPKEAILSSGSFEKKLIDKESALQIHRLLKSLEEPYKEVFWMRTFGELSFSEIAFLFGKTESWARVTYHRAKLKIKEGLK